jgi:hypothetical protein
LLTVARTEIKEYKVLLNFIRVFFL